MIHGTGKRWLYLITDFSYGKEKICEALKAGIDFIQLREKNISSAEYLRRARLLMEWAEHSRAKVIINDRVDIAMLCGADGVHLGQEDIPVRDARRLLGEGKLIGATAKTPEQAGAAEKESADYLGSGAWFPTHTKEDAVPITEERYRQILDAVQIPNVAVGGITAGNCGRPLECGCDGLAVSGGIMKAEDISGTIREFRRKMG
ncbi:thiamine phosphate synthase [Lachnospiraceae bacterium 46-15]